MNCTFVYINNKFRNVKKLVFLDFISDPDPYQNETDPKH